MHATHRRDRFRWLTLLLACVLPACSDDGPTGAGSQPSLYPRDGAVLTAEFVVSIGTDAVDSMVVFLDDARLAAVTAPPFVWPLRLIDHPVGEHTLAVTVFTGDTREQLAAGILMCRGRGFRVGNYAPDFSLVGLDGQTRSITPSARTKVFLLDFWASWCGPCRVSLPETQRLYDEYGDRGLQVLAISHEDRATIQQFIDENDYTFPVLHDERAFVTHFYGISAIPTYYVLDRRGIVRHVRIGADGPPLENVIRPLL